jgi:CheY-like chemotaxis protein
VDDDDDVARAYTRILERHGMVVHRARNGSEAIAMIHSGEPLRAAVVDLILPGIGGIEVVKALRTRHPGCRIVAVTGLGEPALEAPLRAAGADVFLVKPVDLPVMLKAIGVGD